eukprot:s3249_g2.t1
MKRPSIVLGVALVLEVAVALKYAGVATSAAPCHIFTLWNYSRPVPEYIHLNLQSWELASQGRCGAPILVNRSNVRQWIPDAPEEPPAMPWGTRQELFRIPYEAAESDAIRYALIYHNGGIYMDTDFLAIDMIEFLTMTSSATPPSTKAFTRDSDLDDTAGSWIETAYENQGLYELERVQMPHAGEARDGHGMPWREGKAPDLIPAGMEDLVAYGRQEGLTEEEIQKVLRLNRPLTDAGWVDASDLGAEAQVIAKESLEAGRYLEYCCYETTGAAQGRAVIKLRSWEADDLATADHGECSDPYYQWYADHDLKERGAVYHFCQSKHSTCRFKLPRGDRRVVIHLDR